MVIGSLPGIETIGPFSPKDTVGWNLAVPDVWRARYIASQIAASDREGRMPQLIIICLPNDHTSGTKRGLAHAGRLVADNDLAFGRIVEAFSHSRFWKETVIFGIEDDPAERLRPCQRLPDLRLLRQPLHEARRGRPHPVQHDEPSPDDRADPRPAADEPDRRHGDTHVRLFHGDAGLPAVRGRSELRPSRRDEPAARKRSPTPCSAGTPSSPRRLDLRKADACPEDVLNRILWRAVKGCSEPYPAWAVTLSLGHDDDDDRQ